jgi:hypothetical protein
LLQRGAADETLYELIESNDAVTREQVLHGFPGDDAHLVHGEPRGRSRRLRGPEIDRLVRSRPLPSLTLKCSGSRAGWLAG